MPPCCVLLAAAVLPRAVGVLVGGLVGVAGVADVVVGVVVGVVTGGCTGAVSTSLVVASGPGPAVVASATFCVVGTAVAGNVVGTAVVGTAVVGTAVTGIVVVVVVVVTVVAGLVVVADVKQVYPWALIIWYTRGVPPPPPPPPPPPSPPRTTTHCPKGTVCFSPLPSCEPGSVKPRAKPGHRATSIGRSEWVACTVEGKTGLKCNREPTWIHHYRQHALN